LLNDACPYGTLFIFLLLNLADTNLAPYSIFLSFLAFPVNDPLLQVLPLLAVFPFSTPV
jgi:hypothetical protein